MNNISQLIGNTPLVDLSTFSHNKKVKIYGKLEGQNPGGSVKDRAALSMIERAIERGDIARGDQLVEATSGNTGIALAMIAATKGLKLTLIMPDSATPERIKSMKAYGAAVILTPAAKSIEYSREMAEEMAASGSHYLLNQFANPDNPLAHYRSTGPEIWQSTQGAVTHFVSAMGTTGTIMGVSKYLKEQNKKVRIIGVQPKEGAKIPGIRRWSPAFLPEIFDPEAVDHIIDIDQQEAVDTCRKMAARAGVMAGMSSGGALAAARQLSAGLEEGLIVSIICDRGDRYLSSKLYEV
jgi:cysteine synthase B